MNTPIFKIEKRSEQLPKADGESTQLDKHKKGSSALSHHGNANSNHNDIIITRSLLWLCKMIQQYYVKQSGNFS